MYCCWRDNKDDDSRSHDHQLLANAIIPSCSRRYTLLRLYCKYISIYIYIYELILSSLLYYYVFLGIALIFMHVFLESRTVYKWRMYWVGVGAGDVLSKIKCNIFHFVVIKFLQVKETNFTRLCSSKTMMTVNDSFPGPVLRARNGDTIFVNVHNQGEDGLTIHWYGYCYCMV